MLVSRCCTPVSVPDLLPGAATPSFSEQRLQAIAAVFGEAPTGRQNRSW
jgi:hypothetical protein